MWLLVFCQKTGACWAGGVKCLILVILRAPAWIWGRASHQCFPVALGRCWWGDQKHRSRPDWETPLDFLGNAAYLVMFLAVTTISLRMVLSEEGSHFCSFKDINESVKACKSRAVCCKVAFPGPSARGRVLLG